MALPRVLQLPFRLVALAATALALPSTAPAQTVTLRFSGTANFVGAPLASSFAVGNPYTFTLTYNPAAAGTYSGDTSRTFTAQSASFTIQGTAGAWTSTLTDPRIQITDGSYDEFSVTTWDTFTNTTVGGRTLSSVNLRLYANAPGPLSTFLTAPSDLTLTGWSTAPSSTGFYTYWLPGGGTDFMRFGISSIENLSAVPEPSTYALLGGLAALGGVLWHRRRARRQAIAKLS
jgi:hypothetical protein